MCDARFFTCKARVVRALTDLPFVLQPYVWCELTSEFVAQPHPQLDRVETGSDTQFGNVLRLQITFGPRLQDQPLGNALVQFGFETCRQIAPGRKDSGPLELENI